MAVANTLLELEKMLFSVQVAHEEDIFRKRLFPT
jgi:hypothetical protein